MANANNKTIYIVIGIVALVVSIPVVIALLGFIGGLFFYYQGAN